MPTWRCPHCGTPQTETARCWVCRRSSTACGTCRHFRRSVAAQVGYCGLDRRRAPLAGDEIRACWEATPASLETGPGPITATAGPGQRDERAGRLEFVEVGRAEDTAASLERVSGATSATATATVGEPAADGLDVAATAASAAARSGEPGWNLWGDLEI